MSNHYLTQEQRGAVVAVFKSTSCGIVKHLPSWDYSLATEQFKSLQSTLAGMAGGIGSMAFALEITQLKDAGRPALTAKHILQANESQATILRLGRGLRILGYRRLQRSSSAALSPEKMSAASDKKVILVREANNLIQIYADGRVVAFFDLLSPHVAPAMVSRYQRRAEDYEHSILDHYRNHVCFCQNTDHWKDRKKRILFPQRGTLKTEDIFHQNLHCWLSQFLDAQVVRKAKLTSKDELDLLIHAPNGRSYAIEVKWMGTNGKTSYRIKDLEKGLKQVHVYLKRHGYVSRATLVAYDGRNEGEFDKLSYVIEEREGFKRLDACGGTKAPDRGSCMVLFLQSKTASDQ